LSRAETNYQAVRQILEGRTPAGAMAPPAARVAVAPSVPRPASLSPSPTRPDTTGAAPRKRVAPPPTPARDSVAQAAAPASGKQYETGPSAPTHWPLDVTGFVTRGQIETADSESHEGIDVAVPVGSQIHAAGGGTVAAADSSPDYGWFVLLRHPNGYESMYGHASRLLVHAGMDVQAGQVIALSGNSGRSTAPHLHFEIRLGGRSVDPLTLVKEGN